MTLGDIGGKTATSKGLDPEGGVSLEGLDVLAGVDGFMITEDEDSAAYQALVASKLWQRLPAVQAGNVTSLGAPPSTVRSTRFPTWRRVGMPCTTRSAEASADRTDEFR